MDALKSHAGEYTNLLLCILKEDPLNVCSHKHLERDSETVRSRVSQEGVQFLTKTLPKLGKALYLGLETGLLHCPREFARIPGGDSRPALLQAYFKLVFDADGRLLEAAEPRAVKHLVQALFMFYKLNLPYKVEESARVIANFLETEKDLERVDDDTTATEAAASYIIRDIFANFDWKAIIPRHGPGAVATGERGTEKWNFSRLYDRIHQVYPYYDYYVVGRGRELLDRKDWYKKLDRLDAGIAKVVLVPKDSRGPRLISCEPLEYQWIQQGLGRRIVDHLEHHWMTLGRINFRDQTINQRLALESSKTREYATLDLKDASDRISVKLVQKLFRHNDGLLRALLGCRTVGTTLPTKEVVGLLKFAPMGSALCFPILATTVWALAVAATCRQFNLKPSEVGRHVYVFGDDVIVKTEWVDCVVTALEESRLRVNREKSYVRGSFRESCGMDAFQGVQITPVRVRDPLPPEDRTPLGLNGSRRPRARSVARGDGNQKVQRGLRRGDIGGRFLASWVALANNLSVSGYREAAASVRRSVEHRYGKIPYGISTSSYICWHVSSLVGATGENRRERHRVRYDPALQRLRVYAPFLKGRVEEFDVDGWPRLLRAVTQGAGLDPDNVVVPRSTLIKRGWKLM